MAEHANETSGIRFPPPLIYAGLFALGYVLHRLLPVRLAPPGPARVVGWVFVAGALILRSEEHTSELQSRLHLVCRLLLEKKKKSVHYYHTPDITQPASNHTSAT